MNEFLAATSIWAPGLGVMLLLTVLSGFFSASETALFCLTHDELRSFRTGRRREQLAAMLVGDPDRLLTGVLFFNLLVNLMYFGISVMVGQRLARSGQQVAGGVFGVVGVALLITLGEVIPKGLGVSQHRSIARLVSLPLAAMLRLLDPIMPPFHRMTRAIRRTFWPKLRIEPMLRSADLERAVEATHQSEEVVRSERQVLHHILDLSEIAIEEVMRPRGSFLALRTPIDLASLRGGPPPGDFIAIRDEHSDEIRGILALADISGLTKLEQEIEEFVYVPWCANAATTLQLLREQFRSAACVLNEYGESIGIVTYEDLLDTILSSDPSRARRILQRDAVIPLGDGRWQVEGISTLRYLCRRLGLPFEPESELAVTVAGLMSESLDRLPEVGDELLWHGYRIRVTEATRPGRFQAVMTPEHGP